MNEPRMNRPAVTTFSIVAADLGTGDLGVAVASKFLAVGAVVPWASAGAGAVATQSYANTTFGPEGLALMRDGLSAAQALERLVAADAGRDQRQVGLVDARGGAAAHTGPACHGWAGHHVGEGFACQGNLLANAETIQAMASAYRDASGALAERLCTALGAGDAAGGDRRGRQSAALYVVRPKGGYLGHNDVLVDLRVDDSPVPIPELERLLELHRLYFASSPAEERLSIDAAILRELQAIMKVLGHYEGAATGAWDEAIRRALEAAVGSENLEERVDLDARTIDPPALDFLRRRARNDRA